MVLPLKVSQTAKENDGQTEVMILICSIKQTVGKCLLLVDFICRLWKIRLLMRSYYLKLKKIPL